MRSRTRAERQRLAKWRSILVLTVVAAIVVAMFAAISTQTAALVDPVSLCPKQTPVQAHTMLVVDISDLPTPQHRAALARWIDRLKERVARHEMLSVRIMADKGEVAATPIFSRCNPGDGRETSSWWGDPDEARSRWETGFRDALLEALEKALAGRQPTKRSAILESLDAVMWDDSFGAQVPLRRLIVVSDLMQNMPGHNHYKHIPTAETFLRTPLGQSLRAKVWTNLAVELVYLPNADVPLKQGTKHLQFWRDLFAKLGVGDIRVLPPFALTSI